VQRIASFKHRYLYPFPPIGLSFLTPITSSSPLVVVSTSILINRRLTSIIVLAVLVAITIPQRSQNRLDILVHRHKILSQRSYLMSQSHRIRLRFCYSDFYCFQLAFYSHQSSLHHA
ncbi:hypothetical protein V8G54_029732, partial [Vigna mungo]